MRLLNTRTLELKRFNDSQIPVYAILSHTWEEEEVTLQELHTREARQKKGYKKILEFCREAVIHGFDWGWVDTCCTIQTHHRRQCTTKSAAYVAESGGTMYIAF
jgi:hypothetical protein